MYNKVQRWNVKVHNFVNYNIMMILNINVKYLRKLKIECNWENKNYDLPYLFFVVPTNYLSN